MGLIALKVIGRCHRWRAWVKGGWDLVGLIKPSILPSSCHAYALCVRHFLAMLPERCRHEKSGSLDYGIIGILTPQPNTSPGYSSDE